MRKTRNPVGAREMKLSPAGLLCETEAATLAESDNNAGRGNPGAPAQPGATDLSSGADEPTAMWDEASLREAGFNSVAQLEQQSDATPGAPANPGAAPEAPKGPSILVEGMPDASEVIRTPAGTIRPTAGTRAVPKRPSSGLSWPVTVGLAIALGGLVYLVVRLLR